MITGNTAEKNMPTHHSGSGETAGTAAWFERVRKLVASGSAVRFTPQGYSMWPALWPGRDMVTLGPPSAMKRGDIVLAHCCRSKLVVLHRVRELTAEGVVLMGDANLYQTEICTFDCVAGKIVAVDGARSASFRRRLSAAIQNLPPASRRFAVKILNLLRR